jgi:hypothetical protein
MASVARPLRVFIGPVEIAGHYAGLAAALRGIGVDAIAVDLSGHPFRYVNQPPDGLWLRLAYGSAERFRRSRGQPMALRAVWRAVEIVLRVPLLLWALTRFDAFVFGFAETILFRLELPLLRLLGKRIVFVFNGSDARPSYVDGADMAPSLRRTVDDCIRLTRRKKARLRRIERYADAIVSQPAFSHFFERPVFDFFRMGVLWQEAPTGQVERSRHEGIRVLHSPSHPEVKGSEQIRDAVDRVRQTGLPVNLVELRGVTNDVVRTEIARSDFVIDQLYSDAPMVGFATEAASAAVPAIVGGYAWPELRRIYPGDAMPPVEACHPDALEATIARLASDAAHRIDVGRRARDFVTGTWAPSAVASRYLAVLRGEPDPSWWFDPRTIDYVGGVGMNEERARALVRAVIERGGRQALQLADKPILEQAFVDFAAGRRGPT